MSERISRRDFARKASIAGLAAASSIAIAQDAKKPVPPKKPTAAELAAEAELKGLEAKLEKPLPAKMKDPAKAALANIRRNANERRKFALPEGSEPCTSFVPSAAKDKAR